MSITSALARGFPPPEYLTMAGAGIDVSGGSVKAITLGSVHGHTTLASVRAVPLTPGTVTLGEIEDPDKLFEVLRLLRSRERIRFAHVALSERKAYLYQTLVEGGEQDLRAAVEFDLEAHVPIPPSEAVFDFEVVRRIEAGTIVSVTAYARRIVDEYEKVFTRAGMTIRSLEIESQAVARALATEEDRERTVAIVDFGKSTTRIAILDHGVVGFTATVDVGGDALTSAVMKQLNVAEPEAEKIKNDRGFLEGKENRDLYETLMTTVSVLKDEVVRHISFWNSPQEETVPRTPVEGIVVVGGNANLKGLPEYLSRAVNLPVTVGNVWANAFSLDEYVPSMTYEESLEYATAIGLALRSHMHTW